MRTTITALFALGGFQIASWAVRIPDVATQVGATHAALGGALLCVSLGALATMRPTAALCDRAGPGRVSAVAAALLSAALVLPGLVHSVSALSAALVVLGAATGMLNVAMNSLGVRLEARAAQPLLPSLHAAFSFGGLGGSIVGGLVAGTLGPAVHLAAVASAGLLLVGTLTRRLVGMDALLSLPRGAGPGLSESPALGGVRAQVLTLGAIAGCTAYGEGALGDWAALHLTTDLHALPVLAAAGYAGFSLAMACGRLGAPALLGVLGETRLLVSGALLAAVGMLFAALSSTVGTALVGLAVVGLGLANVFPLSIARAGALAGSRGVGLASTVGYGGLLLGPALIGFLAGRVGLPAALTTISALALVAASLAAGVSGAGVVDARAAVGLLWSHAEVRARLRASLVPVSSAVHGAVRAHATGLALIAPDALAGRHPTASPHAGPVASRFADLELLLGASTSPSAS